MNKSDYYPHFTDEESKARRCYIAQGHMAGARKRQDSDSGMLNLKDH